MNRILIAAALAAAFVPAMVLETGAAHAGQLARDYQLACDNSRGMPRVTNTTPHTIPEGTQVRVTYRLPTRQIVSSVWRTLWAIAPGASFHQGNGLRAADSCAAAVTLKLNVTSKIERRPQLGRPLIEKAPKRI